MKAFDEDGDGELNEGEFGSWFSGDGRLDLAWRKSLFDAIAADGSGAMSREEYRAALDLWDFTAGALFSDVTRFISVMGVLNSMLALREGLMSAYAPWKVPIITFWKMPSHLSSQISLHH